jgi:transposase
LAAVIEGKFAVQLHRRYLNQWLRRHGITPQVPQRQPRERDPLLIEASTAADALSAPVPSA